MIVVTLVTAYVAFALGLWFLAEYAWMRHHHLTWRDLLEEEYDGWDWLDWVLRVVWVLGWPISLPYSLWKLHQERRDGEE